MAISLRLRTARFSRRLVITPSHAGLVLKEQLPVYVYAHHASERFNHRGVSLQYFFDQRIQVVDEIMGKMLPVLYHPISGKVNEKPFPFCCSWRWRQLYV